MEGEGELAWAEQWLATGGVAKGTTATVLRSRLRAAKVICRATLGGVGPATNPTNLTKEQDPRLILPKGSGLRGSAAGGWHPLRPAGERLYDIFF